jgi:DNA-binding NtrC family response regulator
VADAADGEAALALQAMGLGAYDYHTTPFQLGEVLLTIRNARERERLRCANQVLRRDLQRALGDCPIVATGIRD